MSAFALRYAHAMDSVAASQHLDRNAVRNHLTDFAATIRESHDLREVLLNPALPHDQKLKLLDAIAGRMGMDRAVRNFIAVLVDHQRIEEIDEIVAEYLSVADSSTGVGEAVITSARVLNDADRQALAEEASKLAGGNVRIEWKEDASLLGGAIVKIGSKVYDGSVRAQLGQLERHLAGAL